MFDGFFTYLVSYPFIHKNYETKVVNIFYYLVGNSNG